MKLIPLKKQYSLSEDDINKLGSWMTMGHSLEEICFYFHEKMTVEQLFAVATVIAREMFNMSLNELCPELVAERRALSQEHHEAWQRRRENQKVLSIIKGNLEDITLFEFEAQRRRATA